MDKNYTIADVATFPWVHNLACKVRHGHATESCHHR